MYVSRGKVIVDCGYEFLAEFKTMIQANYCVGVKPITSRNPQASFTLERVHQMHTYIQDTRHGTQQ